MQRAPGRTGLVLWKCLPAILLVVENRGMIKTGRWTAGAAGFLLYLPNGNRIERIPPNIFSKVDILDWKYVVRGKNVSRTGSNG